MDINKSQILLKMQVITTVSYNKIVHKHLFSKNVKKIKLSEIVLTKFRRMINAKLMRAAVTVVTRLAFWYMRLTVVVPTVLFTWICRGNSCRAASMETRYAITPITEPIASAAWKTNFKLKALGRKNK